MEQLPKVSIIVLNYNGKEHLQECFESLSVLEYPQNKLEIIMMDNCSSDGSVEYVRDNFEFVKVVACKKNLGFAGGNNYAVDSSSGEVLVFLNNDTRVEKDWLFELTKNLSDEVMVCASRLMDYDNPKECGSAGGVISFLGRGYDRHAGKEGMCDETEPRYTSYACGAAVAVKKDYFEEIGRFAPNYFIYEEDVELGWKTWLLGYKVLYIPTAVVYHKFGGAMGKKFSPSRVFLGTKNMLSNIFRNFELGNMIVCLLVSVGFSLFEILFLLKRLQLKEVLLVPKAYFWCLSNIGHNLEKRRWIQERRKVSDKELKVLGMIDPFTKSIKEYFRLRK